MCGRGRAGTAAAHCDPEKWSRDRAPTHGKSSPARPAACRLCKAEPPSAGRRLSRAILLAGFQDAEASTQGEKVALSRQANNDLSAIAQAYGEAYAQDVTAYVRMIADGKGISRRYSRDGFEFRRFRTQKHDIYFRYHGDGIAVARVLVPYFMRPDKGQPAKAPRPPRV